MGNSKS